MEPRYRLVFAGRLIEGVDPEQAIAALAERFQVRELTARKMISGGRRHVLKHDLDLERAQRYASILQGIGLQTELEPEQPVGGADSALALEPSILSPQSAMVPDDEPPRQPSRQSPTEPDPGSTRCPKCGAVAVSPVTGVCDACGVVAERYLARLETQGAGGGAGGADPKGPAPAEPDESQKDGSGESPWDPCSVSVGRGWGWVGDAWSQFKEQPWAWVGALVLFLLVSMALGLVPVVGGLALGILGPMLTGGLMIGAHAQWGGGRFEIAHLFAGFSRNPGGLALVGVAYLGFSLLLGLVIALALVLGASALAPDLSALELDPGRMDPLELGPLGPMMLLPLLLGLVLGIPLMMAILFAPALVALDSIPVGRALWLSLLGCWRNLLALLVFGLVALVLGIVTVLTFGLALLLVMPLLTLALYHAYRDIYRC
jgi:hypothetical protein